MSLLSFTRFYLVGIKGVAMTSLAQCLLDAGKEVSGSDVPGEFVTTFLLNKRAIQVDLGFDGPVPSEVECVIYTAAHGGPQNPQVLQAQARSMPVFSHAEALGLLFNQKQGIAVCGVGGKSTTSAMIAWILEDTGVNPSFSIGVGNIINLDKTGQWSAESHYFVAEADEYVTDPGAVQRNEPITPRFSYLRPAITVCTNLQFDHPDVYENFDHTQAVFKTFFSQIQEQGTLLINADDSVLLNLAQAVASNQPLKLLSYGENSDADIVLTTFNPQPRNTRSSFSYQQKSYQLELSIPGKFNVMNALAAVGAAVAVGVPAQVAVASLGRFRSTWRRSQLIAEKQGVTFYDDYAHHPDEVRQVINAFKEWYPHKKMVVVFQPHTYSRTKALFDQFVLAFDKADEVLLLDIFASARESVDDSISSEHLSRAIAAQFPLKLVKNLETIESAATYLSAHLKPGDVCLTLGAGDIYELHPLISIDATIES